MWEARVVEGRLGEAQQWVRDVVLASARSAGAVAAEAFTAAEPDPRLVVVTRWSDPGWVEPAAPEGLLARAHAWDFSPLGAPPNHS
jgi:hypothetical protein